MATCSELGKAALANGDYQRAVEIFERCIRDKKNYNTTNMYFGYGDALACSGRLELALDAYSHIAGQLGGGSVPLDSLHHLSVALLKSVSSSNSSSYCSSVIDRSGSSSNSNRRSQQQPMISSSSSSSSSSGSSCYTAASGGVSDPTTTTVISVGRGGIVVPVFVDPLCCAVCKDVLRCPVTAECGHTFCSECTRSQCCICGARSTTFNSSDVLVLRLVEKWWSPEANDKTIEYMQQNALDEALKSCNESLDKCPNNYQGLLLRSEVLCWLNHFQSSLADADNALKSRPTSHKAYLRRAYALTGLGATEEALIAHCASVCLLHKTSSSTISSVIIQDVAKLLQRLLILTTIRSASHTTSSSAPYSVVSTRRRHQKKHLSIRSVGDHHSHFSDCDDGNSSCGGDDEAADHRRFSRRKRHSSWRRSTNGIAIDSVIPRQNTRLRTLLERIRQEVHKIKRLDGSAHMLKVNISLIDVADFDCVLCYRTLWKPVVTPCGHTYCLVCLDRCLDYSSRCALCKSSFSDDYSQNIVRSLSGNNTTAFIELAMQRFIPHAYNKRRQQEIEREPYVPVFICTTAFPYVPCPLLVNDPRYRLMIRRAIESGERQFGIVQPVHTVGTKRYSDFGTMLNIRDCVQLADGRSILSTVGGRRFRVVERNEKDGYDTAKVQYINDEPVCADQLASGVRQLHDGVLHMAVSWYKSLPDKSKEEILKSFGGMPELEREWASIADGPAWSWYIIALMPLHQTLKVDVLASTSLEKRLLAIRKTLELEHVAAQKRRSVSCVPSCEGLQTCQAIECCQRATSSHDVGGVVVVVDEDLQPIT